MKTEFNSTNKDNIATATVLAAGLFALAIGVFNSRPAVVIHAADVAVQKMDTIVVTASRAPDATLETIVVTASRNINV